MSGTAAVPLAAPMAAVSDGIAVRSPSFRSVATKSDESASVPSTPAAANARGGTALRSNCAVLDCGS